MRPSVSRRDIGRPITYGVIAAVGVIAVRNALVYPAILTSLARTAATPKDVIARYNAIGGERK